jgi:hypothetical protein
LKKKKRFKNDLSFPLRYIGLYDYDEDRGGADDDTRDIDEELEGDKKPIAD